LTDIRESELGKINKICKTEDYQFLLGRTGELMMQ